jgi:CHRD domain
MRRWQLVTAAVAASAVGLVLVGTAGAGGSGDRALFAVLSGDKEVGANGQTGAGDANGRGSFSATLDGRMLCYGIQVKNIGDPMAAHIHRGGRRTSGDVVVPLEHPESGDPGASGACVRVSRRIARALRTNPGGYYVNVHNVAFGNGAVRGQLFARSR